MSIRPLKGESERALKQMVEEYVRDWITSPGFLPFPELLKELEDFAERDAQRKALEYLAQQGQDLNLGYQ